MKIYIRSSSCLSAQDTLYSEGMPDTFVNTSGHKLKALDADYKKYIAPAAARRMGRIIKMGVASAMVCLERAQEKNPDAIIVGTAMGCVEDTEEFLTRMIDNNETLLTPTSFIQSTHNTVAGQIALLLGCNNYNFTYVHRGFSFESALLDAMLLLKEKEASSVLVGGLDELTNNHFEIYNKLGYWKACTSSEDSIRDKAAGVLPGEGTSFFVLRTEKDGDTLAELSALEMIYKPDSALLQKRIIELLKQHELVPADIDALVLGINGHSEEDLLLLSLTETLFPKTPVAAFKHYCGEYPTASAAGLYQSAYLIKNQEAPDAVWQTGNRPKKISNVLFCNGFRKDYQSVTLLSKC